jgi:hypothetical protein
LAIASDDCFSDGYPKVSVLHGEVSNASSARGQVTMIRVLHAMIGSPAQHQFPESTDADGGDPKPFHAGFEQASKGRTRFAIIAKWGNVKCPMGIPPTDGMPHQVEHEVWFSEFSVIALMDHPYRGELGLSPDAFQLIYHQVMQQ